jgi:hypothetical protein
MLVSAPEFAVWAMRSSEENLYHSPLNFSLNEKCAKEEGVELNQ